MLDEKQINRYKSLKERLSGSGLTDGDIQATKNIMKKLEYKMSEEQKEILIKGKTKNNNYNRSQYSSDDGSYWNNDSSFMYNMYYDLNKVYNSYHESKRTRNSLIMECTFCEHFGIFIETDDSKHYKCNTCGFEVSSEEIFDENYIDCICPKCGKFGRHKKEKETLKYKCNNCGECHSYRELKSHFKKSKKCIYCGSSVGTEVEKTKDNKMRFPLHYCYDCNKVYSDLEIKFKDISNYNHKIFNPFTREIEDAIIYSFKDKDNMGYKKYIGYNRVLDIFHDIKLYDMDYIGSNIITIQECRECENDKMIYDHNHQLFCPKCFTKYNIVPAQYGYIIPTNKRLFSLVKIDSNIDFKYLKSISNEPYKMIFLADEKAVKNCIKNSSFKEKITMKLYLFIMDNILRLFKKILTKQK